MKFQEVFVNCNKCLTLAFYFLRNSSLTVIYQNRTTFYLPCSEKDLFKLIFLAFVFVFKSSLVCRVERIYRGDYILQVNP